MNSEEYFISSETVGDLVETQMINTNFYHSFFRTTGNGENSLQ